ncbi:Pumilio homology domain family member 6 [Nakaseomyces bracarensis]|uniref:Pumilio homology domain family member 6 n=1 Tax=Nakaseomyces bracarensis TaxID=273131 RepID=A0ABR4NLT9_9SACH
MAPVSKKRTHSKNEVKSNKKPRISIDSSEDDMYLSLSSSSEVEEEDNEEEEEEDELDISSAEEDVEVAEGDEEEVKDGAEGEEKDSNHHAEQRQLLKERKLKRKAGSEIVHIKSLWEKLRVKTPPPPKQVRDKLCDEIWDLSKDCISDLVMKHDASRIVQTLVKYSSKERREEIVNQLKGKMYVLATSAYGKYLMVKLLHYGSKNSRQVIIDELHGTLRKLMRHREGAYVVEDLFVLYATNEQRQQMIREFWGSEYAVFRETHKNLTLEDVCNSSVEKRNIIARNLIGTITATVEKGSTGFQILHAAMKEYVKIANDKEISEMIELVHEQFAELVHTPEGSFVACNLIARANPKERKLILRALKGHAENLIKNEYGNIIMITAMQSVDDTVLMFKTFSPAVKDHFKEFIIDKYGRRPWLYLLKGLDGKYFAPNVKSELERYEKMSSETSKKPQVQRRHELLNKFGPMYLSCINKNCAEILEENLGAQFISEVITSDELYEQLSEDETKVFKNILEEIKVMFKGDITEESHPIHKPFSTRLLKAMIQGGRWNNKEKKIEPLTKVQGLGIDFACDFYESIIDSTNLVEWINNKDSSFTIVALHETLQGKEEGEQFLEDLKNVKKQIDTSDETNKGAQLLVKLLK